MPSTTTRFFGACAAMSFLSLTACQALHLELVDASVQKPSNVAVYFTVDTKADEPVPGLTAEKFNIYEDGKLISTYESKQTILNPEVATVRYTLLLLDMSGSVVESGQVPLIQEAVGAFSEGVGEQEKVAIYAFDGRAELIELASFESGAGRIKAATSRLAGWKTEDPSTNLNGAVVEATGVINEAMATAEVPLRFGTLVVFTDGTDRAHRATGADAAAAIRDSDVSAYVIGLGGEVDQEEMDRIGPDGVVHVEQKEAVVDAFHQVAERIQGLASRYYLLSYCSPSRAGEHKLEIEAVSGEDRGSLSYRFDAADFEPDCDPNTPPSFEVGGDSSKRKRRPPAASGQATKKAGASVKLRSEAGAGDKAKGGSEESAPAPPPAGY